jgi:hypothetical protein
LLILLFAVKYLKIHQTIIMLLPDNINPENSIYYNGAIVLFALQKQNKQSIIGLYEGVKKQSNMNFSLFILCLDWLFLIDAAILNRNDEIELCI